MHERQAVFVDTGAWIALALVQDPLHPQALESWEMLRDTGARLHTSIPVILETFTYLDRNADRDVAIAWKDSIDNLSGLEILECGLGDLRRSWSWFSRRDPHKLSAVDATSFVLMKRARIRLAFAFDHHFAVAGFRLIG